MISSGGDARIVANAADPFDTPEQIVIRERINCVKSLAHWKILTESESIKEPRGRSRSQSYSQIALLHSHLFLHDQLTFADISGTDSGGRNRRLPRPNPLYQTGRRGGRRSRAAFQQGGDRDWLPPRSADHRGAPRGRVFNQ